MENETTITVKKNTRDVLMTIKISSRAKNLDDVINTLLLKNKEVKRK